MAESSIEWCDQLAAYLAVRFLHPEAVRLLRLGLDNGLKPDTTGWEDIHLKALAYMRENDKAGCVTWDGLKYSWVE